MNTPLILNVIMMNIMCDSSACSSINVLAYSFTREDRYELHPENDLYVSDDVLFAVKYLSDYSAE